MLFRSDVKTVIVDGKILMKDYKVLVLNEEEVMTKAKEHAMKLAEKAKAKTK